MPLNTRQNPQNLADILFTLCVNFLMYVVLILVFYMLVRFYLEEDFEYDERSGMYSPVPRDLVSDNDELSDSEGKVPTRKTKSSDQGGGELEMLHQVGISGSKIDAFDAKNNVKDLARMDMRASTATNRGLGSKLDEEATPAETETGSQEGGSYLLQRSSSDSLWDSMAPNPSDAASSGTGFEGGSGSGSGSSGMMSLLSTFLNPKEWGETEGTKQEVVQRAVFCAIGLNVTFCAWGVLQERILTVPYDAEFFEFSYGLVFMNRLGGFFFSAFLVWYYKVAMVKSPIWEYSFPSVANMLSSWTQYEALKYVSFPAAMLAKAFKMVPVMLMGKFMHNKAYEPYEYISAAFVGFGLYIFLKSSEQLDFEQNVFGDPENITGVWCGVVLLFLFLIFDSFTSQWQQRMFDTHKSMSPLQMMLLMNGFSSVFSFITLVHQEELSVSLQFVYDHPIFLWHLALFTLTANVGQLFIHYTIKHFGAVVFSIIMSVRILLSTLISCFVYVHPITELGVVGILVVFGAVAYRIQRKTAGKALIRFKEAPLSRAQAKKVFSEWHEHLDDC
jgi:adenosine 3'-phospho 5'-phosphosulfate transporter B2